jgi:hypothetical protein
MSSVGAGPFGDPSSSSSKKIGSHNRKREVTLDAVIRVNQADPAASDHHPKPLVERPFGTAGSPLLSSFTNDDRFLARARRLRTRSLLCLDEPVMVSRVAGHLEGHPYGQAAPTMRNAIWTLRSRRLWRRRPGTTEAIHHVMIPEATQKSDASLDAAAILLEAVVQIGARPM